MNIVADYEKKINQLKDTIKKFEEIKENHEQYLEDIEKSYKAGRTSKTNYEDNKKQFNDTITRFSNYIINCKND